jgi:hypothetical protein
MKVAALSVVAAPFAKGGYPGGEAAQTLRQEMEV